MNYYEEFGIQPDAPDAQIRQSYKTLARLLHPDAQPDQAVKAMAERQMTRLNGMLDTLLDPEKRRIYDASLRDADRMRSWLLPVEADLTGHARGWPKVMHAALRQWFWILTGLVIAGLGVWYVAAKDSPVAEVVAPLRAPGVPVPEEPPPAAPPARTAPGSAVRGAAALGAGAVKTEAQPGASDQPGFQELVPPRTIEPPPLSPPAAPADPASEPESSGARSGGPGAGAQHTSWTGNWFYLPQPEDPLDAGLYAPSYIEFLLVEENGNLTGNYRALYKVPNKALSSEVEFRAEGKVPGGNSAMLAWVSDMGAKGEVELTLRSSNLLKVTWWTTAFGRRAALTSGAATLVRQRER